MHIRFMQDDDFETIFNIETLSHTVPWSKGTLLNCQGKNYKNLIIEENDTIQGFAICQQVLDEATLFNIAVLPSSQGKGYAKALLQHLQQLLINDGVSMMWLEVRESNERAKRLYEKMGFVLQGERKNYYPTLEGGRENAWVMAMSL